MIFSDFLNSELLSDFLMHWPRWNFLAFFWLILGDIFKPESIFWHFWTWVNFMIFLTYFLTFLTLSQLLDIFGPESIFWYFWLIESDSSPCSNLTFFDVSMKNSSEWKPSYRQFLYRQIEWFEVFCWSYSSKTAQSAHLLILIKVLAGSRLEDGDMLGLACKMTLWFYPENVCESCVWLIRYES